MTDAELKRLSRTELLEMLLELEQDYKVVLLSGFYVSAYSDLYTIFPVADVTWEDYLQWVLDQSQFYTGLEADPKAHYVMMSACAYVFEDARSVLLGQLVPLDSTGGVPLYENG